MMQQTSLDAYLSLKKDLGHRCKQVYDVIKVSGEHGITNFDISKLLNLPINSITGRTRDLVKLGYVREGHIIINKITRKSSIAWIVK